MKDYAAFLYRTTTPKGRLRAFLDALDAPDAAERIRAAETLAKSRDREALEALTKLIDDASFLTRTPEEKRAFLAAVAEIAGTGAKELLRRQTERPTGVFRRRAGAEVREKAQKLLENLRQITPPSQPRPGASTPPPPGLPGGSVTPPRPALPPPPPAGSAP